MTRAPANGWITNTIIPMRPIGMGMGTGMITITTITVVIVMVTPITTTNPGHASRPGRCLDAHFWG